MLKALQANVMDVQLTNTNTICTKIIAFVTIITYVLLDNQLSPQKVFKLVAWLENLRYVLFMVMGMNLRLTMKAYYSSLRVQVRVPIFLNSRITQ